MTTYTTPHFATGGNARPEPSLNRARPDSGAPYRTAGVTNEAAAMAAMADGRTADWQPGVSQGGVPKAAIGVLGAALVGGVALAIVLMAPSNKVVKHVQPDPIAQATAENQAAQKSVDSTSAAVNEMEKNAPAAGNLPANADATATDTKTTTSTATTKVDTSTAPAAPAPVQAVIPHAPPVVHEQHEHHAKATTSTTRVAPQPQQQAAPQPQQQVAPTVAPAVTPDVPAPAPVVTPPADVQAPAMQQTPDAPTVTPAPTPAPTPDTPAPTPAPAPTE